MLKNSLVVLCFFLVTACDNNSGSGDVTNGFSGIFIGKNVNEAIKALKSTNTQTNDVNKICSDILAANQGQKLSLTDSISLIDATNVYDCTYTGKWRDSCIQEGTISNNLITSEINGVPAKFTAKDRGDGSFEVVKIVVNEQEVPLDQIYQSPEDKVSYKVSEEDLNAIIKTLSGCQAL